MLPAEFFVPCRILQHQYYTATSSSSGAFAVVAVAMLQFESKRCRARQTPGTGCTDGRSQEAALSPLDKRQPCPDMP